jgi:hypothetical protein
MLIRNPSVEENTYRQKGSKLVFDGVQLPSVRRIFARQTRSGADEGGNEADENTEIENGTKAPARRTATARRRRITRQRKGVTGIPASDLQTLSEQPFARCEGEHSLSRGTPSLAYCTVG